MIVYCFFFACQAKKSDFEYVENYLQGLELSESQDKPVFLHFSCYGCMGYDEFHRDLLTSSKVENLLKEEFVSVLLFVDDRTLLVREDTLKVRNILNSKHALWNRMTNKGHVNAIIEQDLFSSNSQPLYVVLDGLGNVLVEPFGYTGRDEAYFLRKLEMGLRSY